MSVSKGGTRPALEKKKSDLSKPEEKREGQKEETYAYNPAGKPDPFKPFLHLTPIRQSRGPLTPLQKYDLSQLKLVAVMAVPEGNVGLVEDATGKGYFVKRGTLIGKNDGRVSKVLSDRLVIEEVFLDVLGQRKVNETSLPLYKLEEGGEK